MSRTDQRLTYGVAGAESSTPRSDGLSAGASKTPPQPPRFVSSLIGRVLSRRGFLDEVFTGLAGIGIAGLLGDELRAEAQRPAKVPGSPAGGRRTSPPGRSGCLQICCPGAASHIDLWDYKPALAAACGGADARRGEPADVPGQERQPDAQPLAVRARPVRAASRSRRSCRTWPGTPTTSPSSTR